MKTFQIRITKEGKHRCLKFKSELPMESVLAAVKAVVKNTYCVSIKEIHWRVPEDRDIMWAIKEAAAVRFYRKVYKETIKEVPSTKMVGYILMPHGTTVEYNVAIITFFNIQIPAPWCIKLDTLQFKKELGLDIYTTVNGPHKFYLRDRYKIECKECATGAMILFYKETIENVITSEMITEEL